MKAPVALILLICLLGSVTPLALGDSCANSGDADAVENVRLQRQVFNRAIVEKDIQGVENVLHEDVILITGTNSDVYSGAKAQVSLWTGDFSDPDRAVYARTPKCIRVSPILPIALEYGGWRGERLITTVDFAAGSYAAKWRRTGDRWLLESEIFATEACSGTFCPDK